MDALFVSGVVFICPGPSASRKHKQPSLLMEGCIYSITQKWDFFHYLFESIGFRGDGKKSL
jgi:hypothetical protein